MCEWVWIYLLEPGGLSSGYSPSLLPSDVGKSLKVRKSSGLAPSLTPQIFTEHLSVPGPAPSASDTVGYVAAGELLLYV